MLTLDKVLSQKQIAADVGINPRRVSDIKRGVYDDNGHLTR